MFGTECYLWNQRIGVLSAKLESGNGLRSHRHGFCCIGALIESSGTNNNYILQIDTVDIFSKIQHESPN